MKRRDLSIEAVWEGEAGYFKGILGKSSGSERR